MVSYLKKKKELGKSESERKKPEHATRLNLQIHDGTTAKEYGQAQEPENAAPTLLPPEEMQPCQHVDFSTLGWTGAFSCLKKGRER